MCRSSYVYNLLYFVICKDVVERPVKENKVLIYVLWTLPISWERKSVSLYDSLKADWAVLSSSVCLLRLLFKMKYLNYLLGFGWLLPSSWAYFIFFLSLLHKHCFQHLYVNVRTLHSFFVHRPMASFMYLLQVVLASCGSGSSLWCWQVICCSSCQSICWGARGRHFVCINTLMRFFSVSVPCKCRDNDGIRPCECVVAQALWEELNVAVTSAALGRDRTSTPISPPEQGLNQKKLRQV